MTTQSIICASFEKFLAIFFFIYHIVSCVNRGVFSVSIFSERFFIEIWNLYRLCSFHFCSDRYNVMHKA